MGRKALKALVVFIFASFNSDFQNPYFSIEFKNIDSLFNLNKCVDTKGKLNKENFWLLKGKLIRKPLVFLYGGCSLTVERTVVVRETRVRLSPSAFEPLGKVPKTR